MSADRLPVVLLEDLPATSDAFGSHRGIANAIFEMVSTERGGRAISLVGDWGTGKSTVVKLLEKAAQEHALVGGESQTEVFVFDAWAHEGDPLRLSFLERLIIALRQRKWVDEDRWATRLNELTKRRRTTETTSSPMLTLTGVFVLVLLYLAPIALALVAGSHYFWHKRAVLSFGVVLYLSPLILAFVHWLKSPSSDNRKRPNLLGMLLNKSVERTVTDALETPEPSSVEFQRVFRELASEALGSRKGPRRNLLLVIDNLDRVEVHDALKLWSSMSAFIEYPTGGSPEWSWRMWTLVPFDEGAIKRLWERGQDEPLGEAFLAKTFQVRFAVPGPLLSDWAAFLGTQLRTAFPKHHDGDFYGISRIFSLLCAGTHPPSPRDIKAFVNQIGSTYRSHPESIPLVDHALLAALTYKGKVWTPGTEIPGLGEITEYVGTDWAADLAALYYNVPKDKASQAIFGPQVENCLLQGDAEGISRLAGKPGLDHLVLGVIHRNVLSWAQTEPFRIGRAAYACKCAAEYTAGMWRETWAKLESAARAAAPFPALDQKSGAGLAVLIKRSDHADLAEPLLRNLSATELHGKAEPRALMTWLSGVSEVLNASIANGREEIVRRIFSLGRTPQDYLAFLGFGQALGTETNLIQYLRPGCEPGVVMVELANRISANGFAAHELAVKNMMAVTVSWDWNHLMGAAASKIQQVNAQPDDIGAIIRTLLRLGWSHDEARNILDGCVQSGWLFHYLFVSHNANFHPATASCLLAVMLYQPEANNPANPASAGQGRNIYRSYMGNPRQGNEAFGALVEQAEELVPMRGLIDAIRRSNVPQGALREIVKALAERPEAAKSFNAKLITEQQEFLRSELGQNQFDRLLAESLSSGDLSAELASRPFATQLIPLYRVSVRSTAGSDVPGHITRGLEAVTKDDWLQALRAGSELVLFLIELHDMWGTIKLDFKFGDALTEFADEALAGTAPKLGSEQCEKLVAVLDGDQRETFQRHLAGEVAEARSSMAVLLKYFGHSLGTCSFLYEVSEDFIREGVPRVLGRSEKLEMDWVSKTLRECPEIPKRSSASSLNALKARIEARLGEKLADPVRTSLEELAAALGIERRSGR